MTRRSVDIELKANSRTAVRELKKLESAAKDADESVEDIESSGKLMARALEQAADAAIDEIDATKRAVDALDGKLGDLDADPREVVADLKRAGLTAKEIEDDVDDLAAALRRAGDVKIRAKEMGFDDVDQALGRTSDSSRVTSTAIGGIGNSISELPGVGSLGPVAESMGMLAENALEGEANLKGLVLAGGGLAAVGLAVNVVQGHFEDMAAIKAFETEQVDDWADSIYEAAEAFDGLVDAYRAVGRVEVRTLNDGIKDVTSHLARAGITIDDWTEAVQGGAEETEILADELDKAGLSGDQAMDVLEGLMFAQDNYTQATRRSAERTAVFGTEADAAARDAAKLNDELDDIPGNYEANVTADTAQARADIEALRQSLNDIAGRISSTASGWLGARSAPVTVYAPAGTNINDLANQNYRRTGVPPGVS